MFINFRKLQTASFHFE